MYVLERGTKDKYTYLLWNPDACTSYDVPPLYDVTIEEFETSALDRLRILAEIESSAARNRTWEELTKVTVAQCKKISAAQNHRRRCIYRGFA